MIKRILICILFLAAVLPATGYAVEPAPSTIDTRLSQALVDYKIELSDEAKNNIASKCLLVQNLLENLQLNTEAIISKRIDTYSFIQEELQAIKIRMIRQGADASETDLLTGKIEFALENFSSLAETYKIALNDTVNVNCQENPQYFQASLVLLRTHRAKLLESAQALKSTFYNADEDIFTQLKKRLMI